MTQAPKESWAFLEVSCPSRFKLPVPLCSSLFFLSFLLAAPESLGFTVGSCWTLMSSSAGLPIEVPCSVRSDGPASGLVKYSVSLGLLEDPAPGVVRQNWLPFERIFAGVSAQQSPHV